MRKFPNLKTKTKNRLFYSPVRLYPYKCPENRQFLRLSLKIGSESHQYFLAGQKESDIVGDVDCLRKNYPNI